jgi:hypothetical protein
MRIDCVVPTADPYVVGKGLDYVQAGFDVQRKGVSAQKVVVSLRLRSFTSAFGSKFHAERSLR